MNNIGATRANSGIAARLDLGPFDRLCADFGNWRIDETIQVMEKKKAEGRVLAFVRGLRLSAHLIYAIRDVLAGSGLKADWGHIVDDEGVKCSPECDVIIHRKHRAQWNGTHQPVMDFKFVDRKEAVAVISCKSYLKSIDHGYEDYSRKIGGYVANVWLFAECCPPRSVKRLQEASRGAGYGKFWYIYTWDGKRSIEPSQEMWFDFLESVESLNISSPK
jgi:hypothetical protein